MDKKNDAQGLPDLSRIPLEKLWTLEPDSVLSHCLAKLKETDQSKAVSAFNSAT